MQHEFHFITRRLFAILIIYDFWRLNLCFSCVWLQEWKLKSQSRSITGNNSASCCSWCRECIPANWNLCFYFILFSSNFGNSIRFNGPMWGHSVWGDKSRHAAHPVRRQLERTQTQHINFYLTHNICDATCDALIPGLPCHLTIRRLLHTSSVPFRILIKLISRGLSIISPSTLA